MGLFRRKQETLNEQLLREAGLDPAQTLGDTAAAPQALPELESEPEPDSSDPPPLPTGDISLGRRGRFEGGTDEWDTMVTVRAATLAGSRIEFTTLPSGDIIIAKEQGDGDVAPLADAVERQVDPPYRATAARQHGDLWAVGAKRIQVAKVELVEGDAIEVSDSDGFQEVRVDGEPSNAEVPELERLGRQEGADYCVEATRIDGDFWEVKVSAL